MIKTYRKKPVEIQAIQFTGNNGGDVMDFVRPNNSIYSASEGGREVWYVRTLEGTMRISVGDYIIKGVKGEAYPCKPDIFEMTYEEL